MKVVANSKTAVTSKMTNDRVLIEFSTKSHELNICGLIELYVEDAWDVIRNLSLDSLTKMYIDTSRIHLDTALYANFVRWQLCTINGENDGTLIVTANWFDNPNPTNPVKFVIKRQYVNDIVRYCFELVQQFINTRRTTVLE